MTAIHSFLRIADSRGLSAQRPAAKVDGRGLIGSARRPPPPPAPQHVLAVAGQKAKAEKLVKQLEDDTKDRYFCLYEIGSVYVSLGDQDTANRWFRKGVEGRADCMAWLGIEPWLDPFRSDPRYVSLLRDIGWAPNAR